MKCKKKEAGLKIEEARSVVHKLMLEKENLTVPEVIEIIIKLDDLLNKY